MPERRAIGQRIEGKDLLHTAVAIGGDHEERAGQGRAGIVNPNDDVVMELTLLPMVEKLVTAEARTDFFEEGT